MCEDQYRAFERKVFMQAGILPTPPNASSTMNEPRYPAVFYTILRNKWKHDGYDASRLTDRDIDDLGAGAEHHVESTPFVAGRLGDGSILRWLEAHKELIQIIFKLGAMILPMLL